MLAGRGAARAARPTHLPWSETRAGETAVAPRAARSARTPLPLRPLLLAAASATPTTATTPTITRYLIEPDAGGPLPPGAQRMQRARPSLLIPGTVLFGLVWLSSDILTIIRVTQPLHTPSGTTGPPAGVPLGDMPVFALSSLGTSVPVLGPLFLALMADTPTWKTYSPAPRWYLFGAAGLQAVGLGLLFAALLLPETVVRRPMAAAPEPQPKPMEWTLLPTAAGAPAGVTFSLSWR